jgi:hypothetical protein
MSAPSPHLRFGMVNLLWMKWQKLPACRLSLYFDICSLFKVVEGPASSKVLQRSKDHDLPQEEMNAVYRHWLAHHVTKQETSFRSVRSWPHWDTPGMAKGSDNRTSSKSWLSWYLDQEKHTGNTMQIALVAMVSNNKLWTKRQMDTTM